MIYFLLEAERDRERQSQKKSRDNKKQGGEDGRDTRGGGVVVGRRGKGRRVQKAMMSLPLVPPPLSSPPSHLSPPSRLGYTKPTVRLFLVFVVLVLYFFSRSKKIKSKMKICCDMLCVLFLSAGCKGRERAGGLGVGVRGVQDPLSIPSIPPSCAMYKTITLSLRQPFP